jgi:hypothetical protein
VPLQVVETQTFSQEAIMNLKVEHPDVRTKSAGRRITPPDVEHLAGDLSKDISLFSISSSKSPDSMFEYATTSILFAETTVYNFDFAVGMWLNISLILGWVMQKALSKSLIDDENTRHFEIKRLID